MATYSDSMIGYADFHSTGRYFALAAAASVLIGASLVYTANGRLHGLAHTSAGRSFAAIAGLVLLGLGLVMTMAALGSLLISHRAKQTITVSPLGVLSKAQGKERFLARDEIIGMAEIPGNRISRGTILVTADTARRLIIPRWIGGYAACLEEIRSLGIPTLPPCARTPTQTILGWLSALAALCGTVLVVHYARPPFDRTHQWMGLGGLAFLWIAVAVLAMWRYSFRFDRAQWRK